MKFIKSNLLLIFTLLIIIFGVIFYYTGTISRLFNGESFILSIKPFTPYVTTISSEPSNLMYYKVNLFNTDGTPSKYTHITNSLIGPGKVIPENVLTDINGEATFYYKPEFLSEDKINQIKKISIKSSVSNEIFFNTNINLISPPIILIHGYREEDNIFNNLKTYLEENKYNTASIEYDSIKGIDSAVQDLQNFINTQKKDYFNKGILVNKFSIISHSFGGIVARYYSSSTSYLNNQDIQKIIFLAVPHKGTEIATLGANIYNDKSIKELSPQSSLFLNIFPKMLNGGLNNNIQIGNILCQYDEVVTPTSANLEQWGIETAIYNVGENTRTLNSIMKGNIVDAPNHNSILNNKKIFEKIKEMLNSNLPFPIKLNSVSK